MFNVQTTQFQIILPLIESQQTHFAFCQIIQLVSDIAVNDKENITGSKIMTLEKRKAQKIVKKRPLTKKSFEGILTKVFTTPVDKPTGGDQEGKRTSVARPSDGCSDTHTNQDKTEGKEG